MGFSTDAIHAGQPPDPATGSVTVPIYQTSTYVYEELGKHRGFDYARTINPTRLALERCAAALESGAHACAYASGMAAIDAVMNLIEAGDHVVASSNLYGGTFRLFEHVLRRHGLEFTFVDTSAPGAIEEALCPRSRLVYVETPTNPMLSLTDLSEVARLCKARALLSVVDNTFMSPFFQRPLEIGIDVVVHSTTKYLNGHSDSVGGIAITRRAELAQRLAFIQNSAGAILSPFDSWLVLRGLKTLPLRMERHDHNARKVAQFLGAHPKVERVYYPGLPEHPQHALACRQMSGFGGMLSFMLPDYAAAKRALDRLRLCALAESLGGVETLICHPASMTHASVPEQERLRLGITEGMVRLSVGVEDVGDIVADLEHGLEAA
ncbi:MAG: PLP-dependent aspartate aminotransferase family protein [Acidobacteriota bacterium]